MKKIVIAIFLFHFLVLTSYMITKHLGKDTSLFDWSSKYAIPFFPQEWEMFAPPPTSNTRLYFRYIRFNEGQKDTSDFKEVLRPLYRHQTKDFYAISRLSYYLFNSSQNMYSNYVYLLTHLPDTVDVCRKDQVAGYIKTRMASSFSHSSLLKYGSHVYQNEFEGESMDSVYMSYHLLDIKIPDFGAEQENTHLAINDLELNAWNSPPYKLF